MLEFSGDTKPQGLVSRFPGSSVKIKQGATQTPAIEGGERLLRKAKSSLATPSYSKIIALDNIQIAVQPNGKLFFSW